MGRRRFFPLAVAALSLAISPDAQGAPEVRVSDGTLSIQGTDDTRLSAVISSSSSEALVYGPPPGQRTLTREFAYGPRFVWAGVAPVPGAGCGPQPADAEGPARIICSGIVRTDIALGRADDYLSIVSSSAPVRVSGGAGDDGLVIASSGESAGATLDGGPGNDSLRAEGAGTIQGGPGDDYISVENTSSKGAGAVVACGPGDDVVIDDYFYLDTEHPTIDQATCGPVLRPVTKGGLRPPPGPDELLFPLPALPRGGRVELKGFRPSEAGRGTLVLKRARSVTREGFPKAGTRWTACSEPRRFRMRQGRVVRTTLTLVPRVARRVAKLRRPRSPFFSRKAMIPCSLHVSGVDDDGERFHRDDLSLVLVNSK